MGKFISMSTHLVSFSTPQYRRSQKLLEASASQFGIDKIQSFTEKDLEKTTFYKENQAIFKQPQGFGYWLWKPFFILETLKKVEKGDIVLYLDAGNEVISALKPLFDLCLLQDILLFQVHTHKNKTWTKRDAFIALDCDTEEYWEAEQICGSPQLYLANDISISFVEEIIKSCLIPSILTDESNILGEPDLPDFKKHRHDQSVISLLGLKKKIIIHRDPSQYGNDFLSDYPHSNYGQILDLHRRKHYSLIDKIKMKFIKIRI